MSQLQFTRLQYMRIKSGRFLNWLKTCNYYRANRNDHIELKMRNIMTQVGTSNIESVRNYNGSPIAIVLSRLSTDKAILDKVVRPRTKPVLGTEMTSSLLLLSSGDIGPT
jgi:hypothetical protein